MYFIEAQAWAMQTRATLRGEYEDAVKVATADEKENKANIGKEFVREIGIDEKVSDQPDAEGSILAFNRTYIEVQAGALQTKRGVVTLVTLPWMYLMWTLVYTTVLSWASCIRGVNVMSGSPATVELYIFTIFLTLMTVAACIGSYQFLWRWLRLENFVQRRLLIRFNRITRQVYLHRPRYAGGIAVLAWEQVSAEAGVGKPEVSGTGTQLLLAWTQDMTGLPHSHLMFVGKTADGTSDLVNLWEFIRRYMEEGPDSVPRPRRLLTKLPWPWLSLAAPWSFLKPLWRAGQRRLVVWLSVLLSPVMLIHAAGHWISLLLCWEPRWPKIIRQAGLPGKPCPPLSVAADWPPVPPPTNAPHPHTGRP